MKKSIYIIIASLIFSSLHCSKLEVDLNEIEYNDPIEIGFLSAFSRSRAKLESRFRAAQLAAEEINAAGGINGRDIKLIRIDDAGSADVATIEVQKMHEQGNDIIIGSGWSSVTLGIAETVVNNNMLMVSYSATNGQITNLDDNDLIWRTCPSDALQGKVAADYSYNTLGKRTVAFVCLDNVWATGMANSFKTTFEAYGGTSVAFEIYPELREDEMNLYDFTSVLDIVFANKPDIVYLASFSTDGAKLTNDIALGNYITADYNPIIFTGDGLKNQDIISNGHPNVTEGMIGTVSAIDLTDANNIKFDNAYTAKWGYEHPSLSDQTYDAVYSVAYAILKANSTVPSEIAAQLRNVTNYDGVGETVINVNEWSKALSVINGGGDIDYNGASGLIELDENGDPGSSTYNIWTIRDGEFVVLSTVSF